MKKIPNYVFKFIIVCCKSQNIYGKSLSHWGSMKTMQLNKVVRSICYFSDNLDSGVPDKLAEIARRLEKRGYEIQTKRICIQGFDIKEIDAAFEDPSLYLSAGALERESAIEQIEDFLNAQNLAFNLDLSSGVQTQDTDLLYKIIQQKPQKTFSYAYTFYNPPSSPFFPSAAYSKDGFSLGLQPTDLSAGCKSIDDWLKKMKLIWNEINLIFQHDADFLGLDASVAPLFSGHSSLVDFVKRVHKSFSRAVTTDVFLHISKFLKDHNPKPIGLCGIMFPCLEDFELAAEYEKGNFSIERNIFLSLHSGLGIDTYPIGIDESPARVFEILCLLHGVAQKYKKPLSARFVSDGRAKIGAQTDLKNPYLKDVVVRPL
jgi:uncharacterized protein (UPF0210 family)